jgi:hypothetical protein
LLYGTNEITEEIMTNSNLKIDVAENGFIIYEQNHNGGIIGKKWAFESAETLADFVQIWGDENTKVKPLPKNGVGAL